MSMHGFTPEQLRLERLQRRIYSLCNTEDELLKYIPSLDNRWAIAQRIAKGLLDGGDGVTVTVVFKETTAL
jgi:hypothetical protein